MRELDGKTMIVTGANAGIGKEAALEFVRRGAHVVMVCRNKEKGEAALVEVQAQGSAELVLCDLSSMGSVSNAAKTLLERCDRIDVLLNNAGLILPSRVESEDGYELTFATNHLGPFHLTTLLLDRIRETPESRIVNVSSDAHRAAVPHLDDLQTTRGYTSMVVYGNSKLFNIWFTRALARRLENDDTTVNCLHPGVVRTSFGDEATMTRVFYKLASPFIKTAKEGAATSIFLATSPKVASVTGRYFANEKERKPRKLAVDVDCEEKLWKLSEELVARALATSTSTSTN